MDKSDLNRIVNEAQLIFFDFDGVIKESVEAKSNAFFSLFLPFGNNIAVRVKEHHEKHAGVSRFEKIPTYLKWAGIEAKSETILKYAEKFSTLSKKKVVSSKWVPGILEFLEKNVDKKILSVVTATPEKEIQDILKILKIDKYFSSVVGSPTPKAEAIGSGLDKFNISAGRAYMIGDSIGDFNSAKKNDVYFILRKTKLNKDLQETLKCTKINNFMG